MLCNRCKKNPAVDGKKKCVACAEYFRNYMAIRRKLAESIVIAPEVTGVKTPKGSVVVKEFPGPVERILMPESLPKKMSPEDFRYFYFLIAGKVFRGNVKNCLYEIIQILEIEILNLN